MASEFASLLKLALARGDSLESLMVKIQEAIAFYLRDESELLVKPSEIVVDPTTGSIYSLREGKNIIPEKLQPKLQEVARTSLIGELAEALPVVSKPNVPGKVTPSGGSFFQRHYTNARSIAISINQILFALTHLIFALLAPVALMEFIDGLVYPRFTPVTVNIALWMAAPGAQLLIWMTALFIVLRKKYFHMPRALGEIFWLCELPLLLMYQIVIMLPGQVHLPGVLLLVGGITIFLITRTIFVVCEEMSERSRRIWMVLFFFGLATAVYAAALNSLAYLMLLIPILQQVFSGLFYNPDWFSIFIAILFGVPFFLLALFPLFLTWSGLRLAKKLFSGLVDTHGKRKATIVVAGVFITWYLLLLWCARQPTLSDLPQHLRKLDSVRTFEEQKDIATSIQKKYKNIHKEIEAYQTKINAYWFKWEPKVEVQRNSYGADMYVDYSYEPSRTDPVDAFRQALTVVAFPFTYRGPSTDTSQLSQIAYKWFGSPDANISDPNAWASVVLSSREYVATVDTTGLFATVDVTDEYVNDSWSEQEVVYEFSLPNDAAVTDLKLGLSLEFPGLISPRGAAERTYEAQLVQRRDPALLEMVGPRQYRLRVYPVPGRTSTFDPPGKQKVRFSYVTQIEAQGVALPIFSRIQNLKDPDGISNTSYFLGAKRARVVGGTHMQMQDGAVESTFCAEFAPSVIESSSSAQLYLSASRDDFSCVISPSGKLDKFADEAKDAQARNNLSGSKIALLFDVSHTRSSTAKLDDFVGRNSYLNTQNTIDIFEYSERLSEPISMKTYRADPNKTFFGVSNTANALLEVPAGYDAVIVVTDSKTVLKDIFESSKLPNPIYFYFDDGIVPTFPSNFSEKYYGNSGVIIDSIEEAFDHIQKNLVNSRIETTTWTHVGKNYSYKIDPSRSIGELSISDLLAAETTQADIVSSITAKHYFLDVLYREYANRTSLERASLLGISRTYRIVTPYTSLIALVNEQQVGLLNELSQQYDAYESNDQRGIGGGGDSFATTDINLSLPFQMPSFGSRLLQLPSPSGNSMETQSGTSDPMQGGGEYGPRTSRSVGGYLVTTLLLLVFGTIFILYKRHKK